MAIGDFLGSIFGGDGSDYYDQAAQQFDSINPPSIEDMRIRLQDLVQQGIYSPEEANTILQEQTAMEDISVDPRLRNAQLQALSQLQEVGETGMSAVDRAQLARIQQDQAAQQRGSREAILQNAAQRGVGGSGLEMASQMINQQAGAGQRNLADLEVAAQAQQNRMNAITQAGQLGGQMGSQEFQQQAQQAQARDAINQFNTQARQATNRFNVDNRNVAQQQNLGERQRISDQNIAQRNMQQQYNKELQQQDFGNRMQLAQGRAGVYAQQAENERATTEGNKQFVGGLIGAGAAAFSDRNVKEDVEPFDSKKFLDELTGHKYKYTDEEYGEGDQVGIMAQSLEKTDAGEMAVDEVDGVKRIDYNKLGGPILASLAEMNKRLDKVEDNKNGK